MLKLICILAILFVKDTDWNTNKKGVVAEGYDVVSYFDGTPKNGNEQFVTTYQGGRFYFSNQVNLNKFKEKPEKYAPAYGGWCAYAMAESGDKVSIDPETYTITDGKLFLFYNRLGNNTLKPWKENESELIKKSLINWQTKYQH